MRILLIVSLLFLVSPLLTSQANMDVITLGADKVEDELYVPYDMKIGPDENIYAFDNKDHSLKVYSPLTGQFLRRIGGEGQAPGEYLGFGGFDFSNDKKIFFIEGHHGHPWITFMELSGKYNRIIKISKKSGYGFNNTNALPDGRIIAEMYKYIWSEKKAALSVDSMYRVLVIIDQSGNISQPLIEKTIPFSVSETPSQSNSIIPFVPDFLWDMTSDNQIVFTLGNTNILEVYNLYGKLIGRIKTPLPEAPKVTSKDLDDWKEKERAKLIKKFGNEGISRKFPAIKRYNESIHERKPIISKISITPSRNILLCEEKPEDEKENKYYIIDFKGKLLAKIMTQAYRITITNNFILYVIDDEEENPFVYCMKRKGSEKDDLLRLNNIRQ